MKKYRFLKDENGFLKQENPEPFEYTIDYKVHQSTDPEMSWLRLGWIMGHIPFDTLQTMSAVDIGSGNGTFVREGQKVFKKLVPYDLAGDSITKEELHNTKWGLVVLSDVLEHFSDISDFWLLSFQYACISYPEHPNGGVPLANWRHYKPNEHLYILNESSFKVWVEKHGCTVVAQGHPEDALRRRWNPDYPNITTFLIKKENF